MALLSAEGPRLVKQVLIDQAGVPFDSAADGPLDQTAEAAHSVARIIHAQDATGRAIERAMLAAVLREPAVHVLTHRTAIDLLTTAITAVPNKFVTLATCAPLARRI